MNSAQLLCTLHNFSSWLTEQTGRNLTHTDTHVPCGWALLLVNSSSGPGSEQLDRSGELDIKSPPNVCRLWGALRGRFLLAPLTIIDWVKSVCWEPRKLLSTHAVSWVESMKSCDSSTTPGMDLMHRIILDLGRTTKRWRTLEGWGSRDRESSLLHVCLKSNQEPHACMTTTCYTLELTVDIFCR